MMNKFIRYLKETGQILSTGECSGPIQEQVQDPLESVLEGVADDTLDYVLGGSVVPRPTIGDVIPPSTQLSVNGIKIGTIDDGSLEFSCPVPGSYRINLDPPWPFMPKEYVVEV